jgi:MFS family permease
VSRRARATALYGLCSAYFVSGLGTAMSAVAIPWLALVTTGSAGSTGVVGFSQMAPYVAVQATAGPLVDRIGLRRTFLGGNTIAAVTVCAIPLLHALGMLSLGGLAALVAGAGAVRGAADAATSPLVPATAARDGVPNERAAAVYSAANRTAMLIGMPVAGVLIAATGAATVVLVDGISFAAAVAVVAATIPRSIGRPRPDAAALDARGYGRELAEGLRFVRADRLLLGLAAMILVTNLLDEALLAVLLPVWAHDRIHEPQALGLVGGAMGLGMLVGVLGVAWLGTRLPRWRTYAVGGLIAASPPFFALAAFGAVPPVVAVCVVSGIGGGVMNPIIGAVQWERVPPQLQARVLGATKASAWLGIPFGSLLGGLLAERAGLTAALVGCGVGMLLATLAPFVFPSWRGLDRAPGERLPSSREPAADASGVAAAAAGREP